jgi:SAM-dependent methyltransferase
MDLPPDPLRFDTVSIGYALHHLSDPAAGLSRLVEVLLPGGMLIVDEPVCDGLEEAQQTSRDIHHFKAGIDRLNGRVHNPTMTSDEVVALVENYGLNDLQTCRENPDSDVGYEQHRSEARSFLDSYLDHIEGRAEHAEFRAVRDHLLAEMERTGLQPQSHIVVVARKPTG